jgi:hypothetical protein
VSYTVDNVITKVRYRLQDYNDESYTDAMLFEYINDGAKDFSYTGCNQTYHDFTAGGSNAYENLSAMTYKFLKVFSVECDGSKLNYATPEEAREWIPTAGIPQGWSVWGDYVYLDAITTASSTVRVWYTYIPDDISATGDNCPLADKWVPALVAYVVGRCLQADRDNDSAMAEYYALKQTAAGIYESMIMRGGN